MNFTEFHFIRPYWLFAYIPYVILLFLAFRSKLHQGNWSQVCDKELLPFVLQQSTTRQSRWPLLTVAISTLLTIFALAGPTWERLPAPVFRNISALVIVLDLSSSMDAEDIKPSRLTRARYKIADILNRRKDGQTALMVYAADAFTVTPLTNDTETINSQLSALTTRIMPAQGSNTSIALQKAVALFKQSGLQNGHILLVTDGVKLEDTLDTAKSLAPYELSILAVGTAEGAPITTPQGGFLKDRSGNIVIPKLKQNDLQQLANSGGGRFQKSSANDNDIKNLLAFVDGQTDREGLQENDLLLDLWVERGPWLLFLILPLAAMTFRRGLLCIPVIFLISVPEISHALEWQDLWQTQNQQAYKAYQQQQYEQAAEQFSDPAWKAASQYKNGQYDKVLETAKDLATADSYYNQGNALAKTGNYQAAIKAYDQALTIDPDNDDTLYNKQLLEKALQKQKNSNKQQQSDQNQPSQNQQNNSQNEDQSNAQNDSQNEDQSKEQTADQNGDQPNQNMTDQNKSQQEESQQASDEQQLDQTKNHTSPKQQQAAEVESENSESLQATEQWLKRIPDDPAGLLRRKFRYQYSKKKPSSNNIEQW